MQLDSLNILSYKNIQELNATFNVKLNCFTGKNGMGKTNLLDSIFYLALCKSNFGVSDQQCVTNGQGSFSINGSFLREEGSFNIVSAYNIKDKKKVIKFNGKKYQRLADHIGTIPLIFITPYDANLINGGGGERRRFIDQFISQFDKEYLSAVLAYQNLLQQRNKLLKTAKYSIDLMGVIDERMSYYSKTIYQRRESVVVNLNEYMAMFYAQISDLESIGIEYQTSLTDFSTIELFEKNRKRDEVLQYTSQGVHRDDLNFMMNNNFIKLIGSQGQKKSFLLALRFAQYQLLSEKMKYKPLLLLDDLFDKLDSERCEKILKVVSGDIFGQIFISDTDKHNLTGIIKSCNVSSTNYKLENGNLIVSG